MRETADADFAALARSLGATVGAIIPSRDIVIKESLAALCVDPQCANYGRAQSCPPHVSGPEGFRGMVVEYPEAFVFKLDVPAEVMLTPEVGDVMRLVHEIGVAVEHTALQNGYAQARSFAGGCCKNLQCGDEPDCAVVDRGAECRHPDRARPSLSGYGVDTQALMETAGWTLKRVDGGATPSADGLGTLCGLVLLSTRPA